MTLPASTVPVLAIIASMLAAAGCATGEAGDAAPPPPAPEVTTAAVAVHEMSDWAEFTGRIEAVETVAVRPRVAGFVESVHFDEGGRVMKGDLLFQLDARPLEAEVARLTAERDRAQAAATLARTYRERAERLLARNATSQEELEQLAADAEVAEAALASVTASLQAAALDLSFTRVTAPIGGRVSRAIVTAGNLVDTTTVLTTLVSDDPVYAYFDVDEQTFLEHVNGNGAAGTAVHVGLIDEQGYPHRARLDFVDNRVDPRQGTIRARAVLDNPEGRFTPGLFARLKLVSPNEFRAALVDDRAIGTDLGRKFVFVVDENDVVQYRQVQTGRALGAMRIVTGGLSRGDEVIINGLQRVRPGMTVAATQVAMGRAPLPQLATALTD